MPRRRELVDANIVPAVQLWSGLEKTGLRTASTVSVGFACRCAAASTVSIGLRGRYTFRPLHTPPPPTALRLADYGGEDEGAWLLLESAPVAEEAAEEEAVAAEEEAAVAAEEAGPVREQAGGGV